MSFSPESVERFANDTQVRQGLEHHSLDDLILYRAHVQGLARSLGSGQVKEILERNRKIAGVFLDARALTLGFDVKKYEAYLRATLL